MLIQKNIFRPFFSFRKYFYLCSPVGAMAERSGTGLQNLVQRFDSASHLQKSPQIVSEGFSIYSSSVEQIVIDGSEHGFGDALDTQFGKKYPFVAFDRIFGLAKH